MPDRREFFKTFMRGSILAGIAAVSGILIFRPGKEEEDCDYHFTCGSCPKLNDCTLPRAIAFVPTVWQLDPAKCIHCGRCATSCVMTPSAVKCTHVFAMCGYCDLCGGYFRPGTKNLTTAAENQLCPTNALKRRFIEEPFFEYTVDESLCIGCGKCVKGCQSFGNGSLQLQIKHDLCQNCNVCSIARNCPSEAFSRVPADRPYLLKGFGKERFSAENNRTKG
ncbi:MAG: 4Fe-4S binding protein [Bacteroidetes bacterium]|nr:4Fe-4S binding protein [Bacteroidota bacterium]